MMCAGCGVVVASFGTTERKARWCGGCGKAHGAINLSAKMCEASGTKRLRQGRPGNLSTSKRLTPEAEAGTRAAAGDATSLLLAMVKQELPSDATCQYYTPGSMYILTALV